MNEVRALEGRDPEAVKAFILARIEERPGRLPTPCWAWLGALDKDGYAVTTLRPVQNILVCRLAFHVWRGPVPARRVTDHLCDFRPCVRYDHLTPATVRRNTLRGTSPAAENARKGRCKRGHRLAGANISKRRDGRRVCKACARRARSRGKLIREKETERCPTV